MNIETIQHKIFEIRGHSVMLDFDIAEMYAVETRVLNQAVKRNIERFPEDFMFQLTEKEWELMRSQIVTSSTGMQPQIAVKEANNSSQFVMSSKSNRGKSYLPYAFSEHGVTMLASTLRSEKAVKVSIAVVRAFISLKKYVLEKKELSSQIHSVKDELMDRIEEHDVQLHEIYRAIDKLIQEKSNKAFIAKEPIGFKTRNSNP